MRLKDDTVNIVDLHPKMLAVIPGIDRWWMANFGYELIITSAVDGNHTTHSRHWIGCAIDARTWTTAGNGIQVRGANRKSLHEELGLMLGGNFQVLDENDHFHIAFKPTKPVTWRNLI